LPPFGRRFARPGAVAAPSYPAQLMFDARLHRALDGLNDQRWGRHGAWRLRAGSVPNRSPIGELRDIIVARLLARCLPLMDVASRVIAEAEIGRLRDPNNSPLPKRPVHEVWADGHAPFRPALPDLQHDSQWLRTGLLQFNAQTRPTRAGPSGTRDAGRCSESCASVFTRRPGGWKPPLRNGCSSGFKPLAGADNGSLFTRTCVTAAGTETWSNFVMAARGKPKFTLRSSPLFSASISTSSVTTWLPGFSTRTTSPSSPEPAATEPPPPAANTSGS